jgi:hypothetical protein
VADVQKQIILSNKFSKSTVFWDLSGNILPMFQSNMLPPSSCPKSKTCMLQITRRHACCFAYSSTLKTEAVHAIETSDCTASLAIVTAIRTWKLIDSLNEKRELNTISLAVSCNFHQVWKDLSFILLRPYCNTSLTDMFCETVWCFCLPCVIAETRASTVTL